MSSEVVISAAVEGDVDEAVVRRLVQHVNARPGAVHVKKGKTNLRQRIHGYNNAAQHGPWIVVVDLDHSADCAPLFRAKWLPDPAPFMCFRIAVREIEAWLLADPQGIASFLRVAQARVPTEPESLNDPKQAMVDLARQSRSREIQKDMVPRPGSGRSIGPAYPSRLIEFASSGWDPEVAARCCDSLRRAIECLERLKRSYGGEDD